jgi:hypothetical protein
MDSVFTTGHVQTFDDGVIEIRRALGQSLVVI